MALDDDACQTRSRGRASDVREKMFFFAIRVTSASLVLVFRSPFLLPNTEFVPGRTFVGGQLFLFSPSN